MRDRMREMFQGGGGPQGDLREAMTNMREEMEKEILGVLTKSQQEKFEELKGEKFEMPENMGRGGRGNFGRGGPGGGAPGAEGGGRRGGSGQGRGPGGEGGGRRGGERPESEF